ncbi:MAG TPA: hypothetical protein VFP12_00820 [Allosphingosinicella sp.]|nr:hypothetical protein [Allosphingosinicella sp.]
MGVIAIALPMLLLAAPAVPEREMLDSFKSACSRTGNDIEAMKADAAASGWTEMAEDSEPRIARLLKLGRDSVEADAKVSGASFRRTLGGRDIFLVLSRYEDKEGIWGTGCRAYDFEATRPFNVKLLNKWMGKPPTGVQEPAPGLSKRLWEPGWRDGITLEVNHVPQNHSVGKTYGLSGNVLVAQAIGGF